MLKNVYEWYRIVSASPDSDTIVKRTSAVRDLIEHLLKADTCQLLIACVAAAADGFGRDFKPKSELVQIVVECIRSHQPAFPSDLSENALELRACCAIALGEILTLREDDKAGPSDDAQLAASMFVSAMGLRPHAQERYLEIVLHELRGMASTALEEAAAIQRRRQNTNYKFLEATVQPDPTTFINQFLPQLKVCFAALEHQAAADREELEVLWWLYNGFSENLNEPLINLAPSVAAICCGTEVANRVMIPPLKSIRQMVLQAANKGRERADLSEKSLESTASQWNKVCNLLVPTEAEMREIVKAFPTLFPLSWLCLRFQESQVVSSWTTEFELKTGILPSQFYSPATIAVQAFDERIAQRIYSDYDEG